MDFRNRPIKDIGEFALIEHLAGVLGSTAYGGEGVIRGIGDDAAVLQQSPGSRLLASCDMLMEGRHFDLDYFTPWQVGWKALAVNLSDIAAMGGRPRWALVSLGLPPTLTVGFIEDLYKGMAELADRYEVIIVGGDTCSSPGGLVIDIAILGEASRYEVAYRSGAQENDILMVTGYLGQAAAGLAHLKKGKEPFLPEADVLHQAHLVPEPRVEQALELMRSDLVGAMNDLSDGLATELYEIVQASGCGARIWADRLPIDNPTEQLARQLGVDPLDWALFGGEDFELLVTVKGSKGFSLKVKGLAQAIKSMTGTPLSIIGSVMPQDEGIAIVYPDGREAELKPGGYNHFSGS